MTQQQIEDVLEERRILEEELRREFGGLFSEETIREELDKIFGKEAD